MHASIFFSQSVTPLQYIAFPSLQSGITVILFLLLFLSLYRQNKEKMAENDSKIPLNPRQASIPFLHEVEGVILLF